MEKKISIILVNYNGGKYNDKCITSVLNSTMRNQIQIIVVDNASTDDSLILLKKKWGCDEQVQIIELDKNYGFSKANNEGIRWSIKQGIKYFLLLNNDTEIEPDTIERMFLQYQKTNGIIVPKILYADRRDTICYAGGSFSPIVKKSIQRGLNQIDKGQFNISGECQFASGCAMFLSEDIVHRIGFLDERFFLYYEDTEYSMRAAQNHIRIWYCAEAVVYHKVNGSTKGNEKPANAYYISRNWLLCNSIHLYKKHHLNSRFYIFLLYFFCNRFAWIIIWFLQGRRNMCRAQMQGIIDFYRKKWGNKE
ncbi:MAG: glycosyltransferase family 2 protein [Butyrivibrio sp.]|nr:glycosyltransferase family 2 protein [Butyrivibrio sp.]